MSYLVLAVFRLTPPERLRRNSSCVSGVHSTSKMVKPPPSDIWYPTS